MPGVGRKSAQRIAFHLLERDRNGASQLSVALADAVKGIGHCKQCRMFTENELCNICMAAGRDGGQLCVVESPADVMVQELIIATNPTVEGDATAHYLADLATKHKVQASRIAHGVPLGGELEYVDSGTLSHAFFGRRVID